MPGCSNFPLRNQRRDVATTDGYPPDNQDYNCVPASIAACIQYWTGDVVAAEDLTDAAYGHAYVGPTSALTFDTKIVNGEQIDQTYGVELDYYEGDRPALIAEIKRQLDAGVPVLITMPSAWDSRDAENSNVDHPNFSTHVGAAARYDGDNLTVMNPWGGFWQTHTWAWWQDRLCFRSVWPVVKVVKVGIPKGWSDDGKTLRNPVNDFVVVGAKRQWILTHEWDPANVPIENVRNVADVEFANKSLGPGNAQTFHLCRLIWANSDGFIRVQYLGDEYLYYVNWVQQLQQQLAAAQHGQVIAPADAALLTLLKSPTARTLIPQLAQALGADASN